MHGAGLGGVLERRPLGMVGRQRAASSTSRTSFTPAAVAESSTNRRRVSWAMISASVVLPTPGGP